MAARPKRRKTTKPKKTIFAVRLPPDLMKTMSGKAAKQFVSRNKLIELVLRDYLARPDTELRGVIQNPATGEADREQIDLFA